MTGLVLPRSLRPTARVRDLRASLSRCCPKVFLCCYFLLYVMPYYGKRRYRKRSIRGRRYGRRRFAGFRAKKPSSAGRSTYLQRLGSRPRRIYKTRGQWRRTGGRIQRPLVGLPAATFVKIRYSVWIAPFTVAAAGQVINIRGNSPYDPEYAVGGGQPRWYDQYAYRYRRYLCHGSAITVTHSSTNGSGEAGPYLWGVHAASPSEITATEQITAPVLSSEAGKLRSRRFTKSKLCDLQAGLPHAPTGGQRNFWIKLFATNKQLQGLGYDRYSNIASTSGNVASSHEWLWQIFFCQSISGNEFTTGVFLRVDVDYYVTFFERFVTFDA